MNKQFKRYLQGSLIVLDLLILNLAIAISKWFFGAVVDSDAYSNAYLSFWLFMNLSWITLSFLDRKSVV